MCLCLRIQAEGMDTHWGRAHIETQADAGQVTAARETLRGTVWAHIGK
jgi:hypothetical protein